MKLLKKISFILVLILVSILGNSASAESLSPTVDFTFTRNLTVGIRGDDVSALQQFLMNSGFLKILAPTNYFGLLTKSALGKWQASLGISPSVGFFGPVSRSRINVAVVPRPISVPLTQSAVPTTTVLVATTSVATTNTNAGSPTNVSNIGSGPYTGVGANLTGLPVRLKITSLNIDAGFQYTGLTAAGVMEIPNNITDIGWFTGSAQPGVKGTSVITGHVAQIHGGVMTKQGVFYNLHTLRVGDKISVTNDKGQLFTFVVREIRSYDPMADATDVFTSSDNGSHMNIITCEGTWNAAQLSYSQRLVVFTDLVSTN